MNDTARNYLTPASRRKIYSAIALAIIFVLMLGQANLAVFLAVAVLPFAVWLSYSAYVFATRPYARLAQTVCVFVWAIAVALVVIIHVIRHNDARRDADEIVKAIAEYSLASKHCPDKLETLATRRPQLSENLRAEFKYICERGKPVFSYRATFTLLDRYDYDFEHSTWKYHSWSEKIDYIHDALSH